MHQSKHEAGKICTVAAFNATFFQHLFSPTGSRACQFVVYVAKSGMH